jgi:hypothetical protein
MDDDIKASTAEFAKGLEDKLIKLVDDGQMLRVLD